MQEMLICVPFFALFLSVMAGGIDIFPSHDILLTNDDGWATAQIHAQNNALKDAKFNVSTSAVMPWVKRLTS
jgi:hypothetical protein